MARFRPLTLDEGKLLIRYVRCIIETCLKCGDCTLEDCMHVLETVREKVLNLRLPVFVTIEKIVTSEGGVSRRVIRGSMGIPVGKLDLARGLMLAAKYAAFRDPRRSCLQPNEWPNCVVEIVLLSDPIPTSVDKLAERLFIGYHAISVYRDSDLIVILPQLQVELLEKLVLEKRWQRRSMSEYLSVLFAEYGVPLNVDKVYLHETQIFYELFPEGEVIERKPYLNRYIRYVIRERTLETRAMREETALKA